MAKSTLEQHRISWWQAAFRYLLPTLLIVAWIVVLAGQHLSLTLQANSWLTFIALLVMPGYLLAELVTWRLRLDSIERLALAFPLSIVILAVPGMAALLQHRTVTELANGWIVTSATVALIWLLVALVRRWPAERAERWSGDQLLWLGLLGIGFATILPALNLYKIDGDAYAVGSFTADALAGLPLNAGEPLFGTDLGPGVRMAFNQSLPMAYLWSLFSGIDSMTLTASASRAMIALWTLLAAYTLGRAAGLTLPGGNNSRRFALLVASTQLAIFIAAPFFRGDNVSIFFFERTTADKFMVPMTILPVVFAFAMRYFGGGRFDAWLAAALATFAVSTIHPLIAAMMALALGAFAGFHWLLNFRSWQTFRRTVAVGCLVAMVMVIPMVQLYLSRGEAPLAASYPTTVEGWPVGHKMTPALPFMYMPTLEVYGPLPDLARLEAIEADSDTNPFLIWRFAVNMERRRLILLDLEHYISDPNIMLEPPYLLALLLLPAVLWKIRRNLAAQFAISTSLATIFVMFNPFVTPLIGSLVMPWILWRFVWLLPYALIFALVLYRILYGIFGAQLASPENRNRFAPLVATIAIFLVVSPSITNTLETMRLRASFPYYYPVPSTIYDKLDQLTRSSGPATVMADQDLSVTMPAFVANANVIGHRVPTTSEIFPADQQIDALQRLIDQETFFRARYLTQESLDILEKYETAYVIAPSGSNLDIQFRLVPEWFEHVEDDQSYSLYSVRELPENSDVIRGNTFMEDRLWQLAEDSYQAAHAGQPGDALALAGLAEIAHVQGRFNDAARHYNLALLYTDEPSLHYRLGQIYDEMGRSEASLAAFQQAVSEAPHIASYNLALADACLVEDDLECAREQLSSAVENGNQPDDVSRMTALADLWRQRNMFAQAIPIYEEIASRWPSVNNQLMLANAYRDTEQYDQAIALLDAATTAHPLSIDALVLLGNVLAASGDTEAAVEQFESAISRQKIQGQSSTDTRLALAQVLLNAGNSDDAQIQLEHVLGLEPYNAIAHSLQGDLYLQTHELEAAMQAYQQAFQLDPSQVGTYLSMTNEMRRQGGRQDHILDLLEQAIKANPDEAMLALALGDHAERRGEVDSAVDAYHTALDLFERYNTPGLAERRSNDSSRAYAYARLAGVSEDKGYLEPAMNYYRAAVAAAAERPWTHVILGDALRRRGEIDEAVDAYEEAIAADEQHLDSYMRLADLYTGLGDIERADAYRLQAMQLALIDTEQQIASRGRHGLTSPTPLVANEFAIAFQSGETLASATKATSPDARAVQATIPTTSINLDDGNDATLRLMTQIYRNEQHPELAIDFYQQIIAAGHEAGWAGTTLAPYYKGLGDLFLQTDQPADAAAAYERAIGLDTWWPQARLGLARATTDLGADEAALNQLRETVEIAPGYVEAQVALASALETFGQSEEALEIYAKIAETHAGNANATLAYARALHNQGDWRMAETVYRDTVAMNPGIADAYVELSSLLSVQARLDEARPLLEKAIQLDQQNANAYLQFGLLEQRADNVNAALDWFNKAADLDTDGAAIDTTLIDILQRNGHYEPAIAYIKEELVERPNDVDLLERLAGTLRTAGRYSEALGTLLLAEQNGLVDARLDAELGELYLQQGRPLAALAAYKQAINRQPDEAAHTLRASEILYGQGEYMSAIAMLRGGLNQVSDPAALYGAMVDIYLDIDEPKQAKKALDDGFDRLGDATALLLAEGDFRLAVNGDEATLAWYDAMLSDHTNDPALYATSANIALANDDAKTAQSKLETAISLAPQEAAYRLLLGDANIAQGKTDQAMEEYRQAMLLEPTLSDAYVSLASLYKEAGLQEEATALFERGMMVAPTDALFLIDYARYLLQIGDSERASQILASADQLTPTAEMFVARADLLISQERAEEALADLEMAIQKEPGAITAYVALSNVYRERDEDLRAEQILVSLQNRFPSFGYEPQNR